MVEDPIGDTKITHSFKQGSGAKGSTGLRLPDPSPDQEVTSDFQWQVM